MFIEIHDTPNPNTLKFMLDENILTSNSTYHFTNKEAAKGSPLALKLMEIEEVKGIFLGMDFISVHIEDETKWEFLQSKIVAYITDFISSGAPVILEDQEIKDSVIKGKNEEEQEIVDKLYELFDERIRPAVAMDGGDIILRGYEDGVVYLSMYGACSGCPSSSVTLKNGIENMLRYYIPEVKEVISIE